MLGTGSRKLLSPSSSMASATPPPALKTQSPPDAPAPSPLGVPTESGASPARSASPSPPPTPPDAHTADGPLPPLRVPPPLDNAAYLCQAPHSATILEPSSIGDGRQRPPFHSPHAVGRSTPPFGSGALSGHFGDGDGDPAAPPVAAAAEEEDPDDTIALAAALEAKATEDGTEDPGEAPVMPVDGDTEGTEIGGSKPSGDDTGAIRGRAHRSSGAVSGDGSSVAEVTARFGAVPSGAGVSVSTPGVIPEEEEEAATGAPQEYSKAAQQAEAEHAAALRQEGGAFPLAAVAADVAEQDEEVPGHGPFGKVPLEPLPGAYCICILVRPRVPAVACCGVLTVHRCLVWGCWCLCGCLRELSSFLFRARYGCSGRAARWVGGCVLSLLALFIVLPASPPLASTDRRVHGRCAAPTWVEPVLRRTWAEDPLC